MSTATQEDSLLLARIDQILKELSTHRITIPADEEVRAYLETHPHGLSLLVPVCAETRHEFPDPVELSLEVYADPETGDEDLKLYVRLATYEAGIWQRLMNVCDRFEEDFARIPSGWLHVTTDYRPAQV